MENEPNSSYTCGKVVQHGTKCDRYVKLTIGDIDKLIRSFVY